MRVTLIQMRVEPGLRSANIVRALDWLDRAGELDPPGDLICLPGRADVGLRERVLMPRGGSFVESVAAKARELGCYVACGYTEMSGEGTCPAAVLIDPDGDIMLRQAACFGDRQPAPASQVRVRHTPLGSLAVIAGLDGETESFVDVLVRAGAGALIVPNLPAEDEAASGEALSTVQRLAGQYGVTLCVTSGLHPSEGGTMIGGPTVVISSEGQCLAQAAENREMILTAEFDLPVVKPSAAQIDKEEAET